MSRSCTYEVTAVRSTRRGKPAEYYFRLGGAPRKPNYQLDNPQGLTA